MYSLGEITGKTPGCQQFPPKNREPQARIYKCLRTGACGAQKDFDVVRFAGDARKTHNIKIFLSAAGASPQTFIGDKP